MANRVAGPCTPRVYAWLRARFWRGDDRASGSLVSFVVGAAVFLIGATYLLHFAMQPPGAQQDALTTADLKSTSDHTMQVLLGGAGVPSTWSDTTSGVDGVSQLGLLQGGSTSRVDAAKFDALTHGSSSAASSNGYVDYPEAKAALGLTGYEFHLRGSPVISSSSDHGVVGMSTFHVAYVGQFTGGQFSSAAVTESDSLASLPIDYNPALHDATTAPTGDKYEDDSTFLRTNLVPNLGIGVTQTLVANGQGTPKDDFTVVNGTAVSPVTGSTTRALAISDGGTASKSSLGYTKGREMRAVVGIADFASVPVTTTMTWTELVNTSGDQGDYGFVELSSDNGATWHAITNGLNARSTDTSGGVSNWTTHTITIDATNCPSCLGAVAVEVAFHWVADTDSTTGKGWIIDDVSIGSTGFSQNFEKPVYDMLVIGSSVAQNALTDNAVKSAIGNYVNVYGGRLMVLGGEQNVQWLQPLMHVGISGSSSSVATPDTTNPLLSVPNELDWSSYSNNNKVWDFSGGSDNGLFTGVVQTTAGQDILALSNTGAFGAYGKNGSVILTTYLPYTMSADQRASFFANTLTYGKYRALYFDLGPTVPTGVPVAVSTRTAVIDMTTDGSGIYVEISITMYIWQGATPASSSSVSATTAVPGAPRALNVTPWNGAAHVYWQWPTSNGTTSDGKNSGYDLWRSTSSGAETLLAHVANTVFDYNDTGLTNGQTYYYNLSTSNSYGRSSSSIEISATPSTTPSAATGFTATGGVGAVVLAWTAPSTGGSALTLYNVYRGATSNSLSLLASFPAASNTTWTDVLGTGVSYYYAVSAQNANGESALTTASAAGAFALPTAPVLAGVGNAALRQITLTWTNATVSAGDSVTAFRIYEGSSAGAETLLGTNGGNLSWTDANIANGSARYYYVAAVSSSGEGSHSNEVSVTNYGVATAPTSLAVAPTAGVGGSLTLTWVGPSSWGTGASGSGFLIFRGTSSGSLTQIAATTNANNVSFEDDNVGGTSTTRYYSVAGYGTGGVGANSSVASGSTWGAPTAPALTATANANARTIALTWTASVPTGGDSISSYKVYEGSTSGGESLIYTTSGNASFTYNNAVNGTTYYFYVVGVASGGGASANSNEASATPKGLAVAPTNLVVSVTSNTAKSLTLTWVPPVNWGAGATGQGFLIFRGTNSSNLVQIAATTNSLNTSFVDSNVGADGATRYYQVAGWSDAGVGANTSVASGTTASVPSAPTIVSVLATCGSKCLAITWTAGSSPSMTVLNFTVYRSSGAGASGHEATYALSNTGSGTTLTLSDNSGMSTSTTYYYKITEWNAVGQSLLSVEASGTTLPV
ncbi:MAG: trimeric autotransporter adhesin [Thermoplasmata archaeon]|nr:trimeric autotransporter adhesin [Thermoplasmata archaeon]